MPRIEFERCDLPITIDAARDADVVIRVGAPGHVRELLVGRERLELDLPVWLADVGLRALPRAAFIWDQSLPEPKALIFRVVLDLVQPELAAFDWERILAPALDAIGWPGETGTYGPSGTMVRTSRVRPRVLNLPFTLPLRVLQVSPRRDHSVDAWVRALFGGHPRTLVEQAVQVHSTADWQAPADWRTVHVVHADDLQVLENAARALSMAEPSRAGTLGWFARWTDQRQTRLVVLHAASTLQAAVGRRLGRALCDKGGPAVLVVEKGAGTADFYHAFYDRLIHDDALDWIVTQSARKGTSVALFGGAGREDAVRPSNVAVGLIELASRPPVRPASLDIGQTRRFNEELHAIEEDWKTFRFDMHEREGLLPLAERLTTLRAIARGDDRMEVFRGPRRSAPAPTPAPADVPRVVNASFWSDATGSMEMIRQSGAVLQRGKLYHLGLAIGPKDTRIETLNLTALLEEQFKWTPDVKGVWVEFGVTGIDFLVVGDPVQQLWLPRTGASEPLYVAVIPTVDGISQLRVGLYFEHNLVQSFRMAAVVAEGNRAFDGDRTGALAQALEVQAARIGEAGYMARLEYSRTSSLQEVERTGARALSITANQLQGKSILTLKGDNVFHVEVYPDDTVRNTVATIRSVVNGISYAGGDGNSVPLYQFGPYTEPNVLDARFDEALRKLASAGADLFTTLAPDDATRAALTSCLAGSRKTIQAAPLLRRKVIPWAFVYDRLYDENAGTIDGQAVEQGVCRAPLPNGGSTPRATACAAHGDCLLHPARQTERMQQGVPLYHERTVACPLHFWGFSHVIEVPAQQVEDGETAKEERTCIVPNGEPLLVAGLNAGLDTQKKHWTTVSGIGKWAEPKYGRDAIIDLLKNPDLDLIYLFCHARGGDVEQPRVEPPYLEFDAQDPRSRIRPKDLADAITWKHGPLIILNACGTLGYSPDALSPFLKALVDGRGAGGILGTEVPVAEILATDVARAFLARFVNGKNAGEALLEVRWDLLAAKNPLGLVYTLYAPAALALDVSGKGDCSRPA